MVGHLRCKQHGIGSRPIGPARPGGGQGGLAERFNAPVLKTGRPIGLMGSNPMPLGSKGVVVKGV